MQSKSLQSAITILTLAFVSSFVSPARAVEPGQVDDFEDGTTQGWVEGPSSPNPPSNIATGGPAGVNDNYVENISSGGFGSGTMMTMFNISQWTGDYLSAGIVAIRAHVKVENSSESSLSLRVGFQRSNQVGLQGVGLVSLTPIVVPNDGNWYEVVFPISSSDLQLVGFNFESYESTMSDVGHFRIYSSETIKFSADGLVATLGVDNITAFVPPTEYQGWVWESGVEEISLSNLTEEYCFGQINLALNDDLTWSANETDIVCWGRTMMNTGRSVYNNTPHSTEDIEFQSTRPLVSAGGNLYEMYGEEVIANVGQGEERFATVLSAPSDGNLLLVGQYNRLSDFGDTGYYLVVDQLVKSTPAIRDARVTTDLENTSWRTPMHSRAASKGNPNVEGFTGLVNSFDLLPAGACTFNNPAVFAPDYDHNRDLTIGIQTDNGMNLNDRAVLAGVNHQSVSNCTYEIDADKYLALNFTVTGINPVQAPFVATARFVVSDDNDYLVWAQEAAGVDSNPNSLMTGFLAPSNMTATDLDGTFLFYLPISEFEASGINHSMGGGDSQEFDLFGRGKLVFDSLMAGTVPTGQAGNWFACDIEMVLDEFGYSYSGLSMDSSITVSTEQSAEDFPFTDCSFNTDADGGLRLWLNLSESGDPDPVEVLFRGYVNDSFEVLSLFNWNFEPDHDGTAIAVDRGALRYMLGMRFTGGDPDGNEDGDELTNLEEFQFPLPPVPPFTRLVGLPDISSNGIPEVGVAIEGSVRVHVRDASTDTLISDINFGDDPAIDMEVIPDLDGGGDPEIAVLGMRPSGQMRAFIKDSVSGAIVGAPLYGSQYVGVDMAVLADYSGNGLPELAVMGQDAAERVRVQVRDPATDTFLNNLYYGTKATAHSMVSLPDVTGNGIEELFTLGIVKLNGYPRGQVRDPSTTLYHKTIFFNSIYDPVKVIALPDIDATGDAEVAELGQDPVSNTVLVQIRDATVGAPPIRSMFLGSSDTAIDMVMIEDTNGNGKPDIAVLLEAPGGTGLVKVRDSLTGVNILNIFYGAITSPKGIAVLDNFADSAAQELAVLGENAGIPRVQIRDAMSGAQINNVDFP